MANSTETISHIRIGQEVHPIDAVSVGGKTLTEIQNSFQEKGLVTSIDENSDDQHYPSAKCMYDIIGDIESRLESI